MRSALLIIAVLLGGGYVATAFIDHVEPYKVIAYTSTTHEMVMTQPAPPVWFTDLWPYADVNLKRYACQAHAAGDDATVVSRINDTLDGDRFNKPSDTEPVTVAQIGPFLEANCV